MVLTVAGVNAIIALLRQSFVPVGCTSSVSPLPSVSLYAFSRGFAFEIVRWLGLEAVGTVRLLGEG